MKGKVKDKHKKVQMREGNAKRILQEYAELSRVTNPLFEIVCAIRIV